MIMRAVSVLEQSKCDIGVTGMWKRGLTARPRFICASLVNVPRVGP